MRLEAEPRLSASRGLSTLVQISAFGGLIATAALLAFTSLKLPLICPLRTLTGIPCPFCGMTTGTVAVMRGSLADALKANPFSIGVIPAAVAGIALRVRSLWRPPSRRQWSRAAIRVGFFALLAGVIISWIFQLFRFDVL